MSEETKYVKWRSFNAYRAEFCGYELDPVDRLIMTVSKLHTHTELQFSERYKGLSFSATMKDGSKCARFKDIHYSHPERWDTILIPATEEQEHYMYQEAKRIEGWPYDLTGLLSFATPMPIIKPHPDKVWCTEADAMVLNKGCEWGFMCHGPDQLQPTMADTILRYLASGRVVHDGERFVK